MSGIIDLWGSTLYMCTFKDSCVWAIALKYDRSLAKYIYAVNMVVFMSLVWKK